MRTKKSYILICLVLIFVSFGLVAGVSASQSKRIMLSMGTPTAGGGANIVSALMAEMWYKYVPDISINVEPFGGNDSCVRAIRENKIEFSMTDSYATENGYHAKKQFEGEKKAPIRLLLGGSPNAYQIMARASSKIRSPYDLKGKKVMGIRPTTRSVDDVFESTLKVYNISKEEVHVQSHSDSNELREALLVGTTDAGFATIGDPGAASAAFAKLTNSVDITMVPMADDKLKELLRVLGPAFSLSFIPPNVYKGTKERINNVSTDMLIICSAGLSDEAAYLLTKAVLSNYDEFKAKHVRAHWFNVQQTLSYRLIPYHPGAIKYFKEIGAWTADHSAFQEKMLAMGK